MRFERTGDIKKSLTIGNAANPIQIGDMYAADGSIPAEYRISPTSANIRQNEGHGILKAVGNGQIRDWENRILIGVYTGEVEKMENGGEMHKFNIEKLGDYKGFYISYNGKSYKIPQE